VARSIWRWRSTNTATRKYDSEDHADTWAFLDRRIDNVMSFEKVKAQVNANPVASKLMAGPNWLLSKLAAPTSTQPDDLPGRMNTK